MIPLLSTLSSKFHFQDYTTFFCQEQLNNWTSYLNIPIFFNLCIKKYITSENSKPPLAKRCTEQRYTVLLTNIHTYCFTNSPTGQTSSKPGVEMYQQPGPVGSQLTSKGDVVPPIQEQGREALPAWTTQPSTSSRR